MDRSARRTVLGMTLKAMVMQCVIKVSGFLRDVTVTLWDQFKDDVQQILAVAQDVIFPTREIIVQNMYYGSINIQLRVKTIEALLDLWERYNNGVLRAALESVLITDEIRKLGEHMEISVTMSEEKYQDALIFFDEVTQHKEKEVEEVTERLGKLSLFIIHGYPIVDQGSTFQAHLARISSKDQIDEVLHQIEQDPKYSEATHIVWAYRYYDDDKETSIDDSDDGGEYLAGRRLQHLLRHIDAPNVVVIVTCWQGEVYLHMDVYKHINERALELSLSHGIAGTCFQTCFQEIPKLLEKFEFKHINKCALELLLSCNLVREEISEQDIPNILEKSERKFEKQKQKKGLEGYKLMKQAEAERQEPADFNIIHSKEITDRKSKFQAHLAHVTSKDQVEQVLEQLKEDNNIAKAKYNMYAYRIYVKDKKSYLEEGRDDGENKAGKRLSKLLEVSKVEDVVVIVTRWHGEIPLGPDRFKHINTCASEVIKMGLDQGLIISSKSSSSGAEQVQTKQKKGKGKHK